MKKHNVGIIGYSWAAGAHLEAINNTSYALVIALCSSRKLDSAEINANHGGTIKFHTDLAQMLTDPNLQAASICSYPGDISDHPYQVQFEAFYKAIDEGRGMPLPAWLMLSKLMNWLLLLTNLPIIIKRKNKKLIFIKVLIIKYL